MESDDSNESSNVLDKDEFSLDVEGNDDSSESSSTDSTESSSSDDDGSFLDFMESDDSNESSNVLDKDEFSLDVEGIDDSSESSSPDSTKSSSSSDDGGKFLDFVENDDSSVNDSDLFTEDVADLLKSDDDMEDNVSSSIENEALLNFNKSDENSRNNNINISGNNSYSYSYNLENDFRNYEGRVNNNFGLPVGNTIDPLKLNLESENNEKGDNKLEKSVNRSKNHFFEAIKNSVNNFPKAIENSKENLVNSFQDLKESSNEINDNSKMVDTGFGGTHNNVTGEVLDLQVTTDGIEDNVPDLGAKLDASAAKIGYGNWKLKSATVEAEASTVPGVPYSNSYGATASLAEVETPTTDFEAFGYDFEISGEASVGSIGSRFGYNIDDDGISIHWEEAFGIGLGGKIDVHK
ncbi:hypothetical protein JOC26_002728 [Sporohalobacter salinus]|nr:hypothetical protein [Sporohalobacter salinus]